MMPTSNAGSHQGNEDGEREDLPFQVTVDAVKQRMERGETFLLLDVREPFEHRIASIGGTLIPLNALPHRLKEIDPDAHIIVMCHHGSRSAQATQFLRLNGYPRTQNMAGGIDAWSRLIDQRIPRY